LKRHKAVWKDLAAPARDLGFRPLPSPDGGEGPRVRRSSPTATWRWVALPWRRAPSCTSTDTRRGIQAHGGPAGGGSADDGMGGGYHNGTRATLRWWLSMMEWQIISKGYFWSEPVRGGKMNTVTMMWAIRTTQDEWGKKQHHKRVVEESLP